jgi:hypothetical protein
MGEKETLDQIVLRLYAFWSQFPSATVQQVLKVLRGSSKTIVMSTLILFCTCAGKCIGTLPAFDKACLELAIHGNCVAQSTCLEAGKHCQNETHETLNQHLPVFDSLQGIVLLDNQSILKNAWSQPLLLQTALA